MWKKAGLTSLMRLAFVLSFSLTATSSIPPLQQPPPNRRPGPIPKATPSDLLAFLAPAPQRSKVNPAVARRLTSSLKFLVPFSPVEARLSRREIISRKLIEDGTRGAGEGADWMVWWPPEPVLELARLAVDSGGDVDIVHRALDPTVIPVPDVESSSENKCQLTSTPYGRRFINKELNSYLEFLFELIVARGPEVGLDVSLSRYDLFHGHLFLANETGRLGILFHAKEYPAYDKQVFPYYMGFCQTDSDVTYDDSMNLRNILWLAPIPDTSSRSWIAPGVLVVLDAHPGGIIYEDLIADYVKVARTMYEGDLGSVAVDVNYLNVGGSTSEYQIFIC
ncbi:hypothetical protein MLD38_017831 [Melastoma candidum]|uniref:Uncharacterized protein n=1 Tax=Melastoma candidum TaxID=119954 RepID=A0ACB9QS32_9MYRT|nr:hypothetical protein MLD38_017831 [Melastoma candidum]